MEPKLPVKIGLTTLPRLMTREQAQRYGERHIPADLKRAGFHVFVAKTIVELHGGEWYRINYGK